MADLEVSIHGERAGTVSDGKGGQALFTYSSEQAGSPGGAAVVSVAGV